MSVLAAVEAAGCCEAMRYLSDTFLCSLRKGFLDTLKLFFLFWVLLFLYWFHQKCWIWGWFGWLFGEMLSGLGLSCVCLCVCFAWALIVVLCCWGWMCCWLPFSEGFRAAGCGRDKGKESFKRVRQKRFWAASCQGAK